MPLPDTYAMARIVVEDIHQREFEIITWWTQVDGATYGQFETSAFAATLDSGVAPSLRAVLPTTCKTLGVFVRLSQAGVIFTARSADNPQAGLVVADALPPQNAVVIRKTAGVAGRPGQGRWYIPLVPETFPTEDVLSAAAITAYQTLGTYLTSPHAFGPVAWNPCHRSRKNDTLLPILGFDVNFYIASQDKRSFRPLL